MSDTQDEPRTLSIDEFNTRFSRLVLSTINRVTTRFRGVVSQEDVREIYATFCVQLAPGPRVIGVAEQLPPEAVVKGPVKLIEPTESGPLPLFVKVTA